jgi:hypothetical protein
MPPQLLALFAPRQPIPFKQPLEKRGNRPLEGIAQVELGISCLLHGSNHFASSPLAVFPCSIVLRQYVATFTHPSLIPPPPEFETFAQRREKRKLARAEANQLYLKHQEEKCTLTCRPWSHRMSECQWQCASFDLYFCVCVYACFFYFIYCIVCRSQGIPNPYPAPLPMR